MNDTTNLIPYRLALAGGWIDQPFISRLNPSPPGSMVVVGVDSSMKFMERAGIASGTRKVAERIWNGRIPSASTDAERQKLVRELYAEENRGRAEPSGSQDMIGLIYPGVCRLDYDANVDGGVFPRHVECNADPAVAQWFQRVLHILPVAPRPAGYNPLEEKNLDPAWIARLGQAGRDCFDAIVNRNLAKLGRSMNECMECWATILPNTVRHRTLTVDLVALLAKYQSRYPGAMYSGCGGGYLFVASEEPVDGAFNVKIRL